MARVFNLNVFWFCFCSSVPYSTKVKTPMLIQVSLQVRKPICVFFKQFFFAVFVEPFNMWGLAKDCEVIISYSDDDFRSGCWNVSQCHHKQSFSGLHSPGWSYFTDLPSYVRSLRCKEFRLLFGKFFTYRVAFSVCGSLIVRLGDFLCFWDWEKLSFLVGNYFLRFSRSRVQSEL